MVLQQQALGEADVPRISLTGRADDTVVITLHGEHDLSTRPELADALHSTRFEPRLIVDLTPCTFIDSTIIAALIAASSRPGQDFTVIAPSGGNVRRTLEFGRIHDLMPLVELLADAG